MKAIQVGSYQDVQERADLLFQIEQLTDEREDLLRKCLSLKQSLKTLKSELT